MSRSVVKVKGKKPKLAKLFWYCTPKKKRDNERAAARKHRAKLKQADIERRDTAAKYKLAMKRRAELAAKGDE